MNRFDEKLNLVFNYTWLTLAVVALCTVVFKGAYHQLFVAGAAIIMFLATRPRKKVHIPDEAYSDLNMQIERAISSLDDDGSGEIVVETDEGPVRVSLCVKLDAHVHKSKFVDEAWGQPRKVTELNFYCYVDIVEVRVTDDNGKAVESDFDEDRIELEYETTDWK